MPPLNIERRADTDLYQALQQHEYCYILTSRQTGKSSLMVRGAEPRPDAEKRRQKVMPQ